MQYVLLVDHPVRTSRATFQARSFRQVRAEIERANPDTTLFVLAGLMRDEFTLEAMADALGVTRRRTPVTPLADVTIRPGDVLLVREGDDLDYYVIG